MDMAGGVDMARFRISRIKHESIEGEHQYGVNFRGKGSWYAVAQSPNAGTRLDAYQRASYLRCQASKW